MPASATVLACEQVGDRLRQLREIVDQPAVPVGGIADRRAKALVTNYEMGDDQEHAIAIEGRGPIEPGRACPARVGGRRAARPRIRADHRAADMLEAVADPEHGRHEEVRDSHADSPPRPFARSGLADWRWLG
jgi:hypothetical protein